MLQDRLCRTSHFNRPKTVIGQFPYVIVEFEEIVCYIQSIIILILVVGYLTNFQKSRNEVVAKDSIKCLSCKQHLVGEDPNYCSFCGHMNSHSKGSNLEK